MRQLTLGMSLVLALAGCVEPERVATERSESPDAASDLANAPPPLEESDGALRSAQAPIIAGSATYERPEVGWLNGCTATLVAPDLLITAAHCTGFSTATYRGSYYELTIKKSATESYKYRVDYYRSFSTALGANDLALLHLATPVPSTVATPAGLTATTPAANAPLSIFGYGCTARGYSTDAVKRRFDFTQGTATNNLCPGDSGGPVMTSDGLVARINSGYWLSPGSGDIFGDVAANYARLVEQAERWGSQIGSGSGTIQTPDAGVSDAGARDAGITDAGTRDAGSGDSCGRYAPFPEYTCATDYKTFIRCRSGSRPEYLYCPQSYTCSPGTRNVMCYR